MVLSSNLPWLERGGMDSFFAISGEQKITVTIPLRRRHWPSEFLIWLERIWEKAPSVPGSCDNETSLGYSGPIIPVRGIVRDPECGISCICQMQGLMEIWAEHDRFEDPGVAPRICREISQSQADWFDGRT
ncbi:activator 1 subunit 3 [Aspergillus luchuensis]|uniref:Activator 1 subunit 3 n=1 Tax=Aspergillus kawachii TaxID=1069201 RepID=A0A146F8B7_ASPKA|nr:activator 1 subunit 3 [Aspergillus luchuensis]